MKENEKSNSKKMQTSEKTPLKQIVKGFTDISVGTVNLFKKAVSSTTKWAKKNRVKEKAEKAKNVTLDFSKKAQAKLKDKTADLKNKHDEKKELKKEKKDRKNMMNGE